MTWEARYPGAECAAYQPGGSSQKIPFIPAIVTEPVRAPAGTQGYSRDVQFDSHLVFVGEGLSETESDTDPVLDVGGSVALMTLQPTSSDTFEERVMMLAQKGAVAVAVFRKDKAAELLRINERSVASILDTFDGTGLTWAKTPALYFKGHDSKVFYTRHWGAGFADATGSYLLYSEQPDFGLVVHEHTHSLFDRSWGKTVSFLTEGLAMYAQAQATDPTLCHRKTRELREAGVSVPLQKLLEHDIGTPGKATDFGYPAAGSFIEFLLQQGGLSKFEELYRKAQPSPDLDLGDLLLAIYGATPSELESAWISSLADIEASETESRMH